MTDPGRDDPRRVTRSDGDLAGASRPIDAATGGPKWLKGAGLAALALVGLLAIVAWQLGVFSSDPDEANLADAIALETSAGADADQAEAEVAAPAATEVPAATTSVPAATEIPAATKAPLVEPTVPSAAAGPITTTANLAGRWTVKQSEATYVGYRIDEILSGVDFTAVGRTTGVEGILDADETSVFAVEIVADLVGLTSDNRVRDSQLKTQALETNKFPEATFVMTKSIPLVDLPADGETINFNAIGDLTVHGVTQPVDIPIEAAIVDEQLFVVGSTEVLLSDYDISTPSAPMVASVSETATMELSLVFSR